MIDDLPDNLAGMTRQPTIIAEYVLDTEEDWRGHRTPGIIVRVETTRDAIPSTLGLLQTALADVRDQLDSLDPAE